MSGAAVSVAVAVVGLTAGVVAIGAIVVALVFVMAAVVIGREARRLDAMPARATIEIDEEVLWVADRLPRAITAELSYSDVRQILEWHLAYLGEHGLEVTSGDPIVVDAPVVVEGTTSVQNVLERAAGAGAGYTAEQVQAVLDFQIAYLVEIGAVGPEAEGGPL